MIASICISVDDIKARRRGFAYLNRGRYILANGQLYRATALVKGPRTQSVRYERVS